MIKVHLALWFVLWPALVLAQTSKSESAQPERITKVVHVQYRDANVLANLAGMGAAVTIQGDNALRAVVIKGRPSDVAEAERTVRELDTPTATPPASKDIELTVYVIEASDKSGPLVEDKLATIAPVVKQLRSVFPYSHYQLLSTMLLRSGQGRKTTTHGLMRGLANTPDFSTYPSLYSVRYEFATVLTGETPPAIHLAQFEFNANVPVATGVNRGDNGKVTVTASQSYEIGIQTDVDLKEGQKVVVGKSNIESSDSALFIVLSAKLL